jgi:hypothetical protein
LATYEILISTATSQERVWGSPTVGVRMSTTRTPEKDQEWRALLESHLRAAIPASEEATATLVVDKTELARYVARDCRAYPATASLSMYGKPKFGKWILDAGTGPDVVEAGKP